MPQTKSFSPILRDDFSADCSADEVFRIGSTPFIMTVIFLGSMPVSVRLSAAACATATISVDRVLLMKPLICLPGKVVRRFGWGKAQWRV